MKKLFLSLILISFYGVAAAAPQLVTLSQFEVGKSQWPFIGEEVMLSCVSNHAMFIINPGTLMQYPVNDVARKYALANSIQIQSLVTILADDPDNPGKKMSIAPILKRLKALCE